MEPSSTTTVANVLVAGSFPPSDLTGPLAEAPRLMSVPGALHVRRVSRTSPRLPQGRTNGNTPA